MLYRIARVLMTITMRLFYRRIYATGIETIPHKGPVILVANHPSSLMDAALLGILLKRPIHYFTRGDVFKNNFLSSIFRALNMIPVYDHAGRNTLRQNEESFGKALEILKKGGLVLFFPEGSSHIDRKLAPLKKGAFRLAFKTANELPPLTPLLIIPVGINYADPVIAQTDVIVHVGTPVDVNDYLTTYTRHPTTAILKLRNDIHKELLRNMANIEEEDRLFTADVCLEIFRNDYRYYTTHWMQATKNRFEEEHKICKAINALPEEEASQLQELAGSYNSEMKLLRLSDEQLAEQPDIIRSNGKLIAGFPLFVISYILNAVPVLMARRIAATKVKRADFYSWVFLTSAALLYCLWIVILFSGFLVTGIRYALVITVITLALGPFTIFYINHRNAFRNQKHYNRLLKLNPNRITELKTQRNTIKEKVMSYEL